MGNDETCSHDSVAGWTTKDLDIFKLDKILIPMNAKQLRWIADEASMLQKATELCDPIGQRQNPQVCLKNVSLFIKDEHLKKRREGEMLPGASSWQLLALQNGSSQRNPMGLTVGCLSRHLSVLQLSRESPFVVASICRDEHEFAASHRF
jgi:hypothetical protein